MYIHLAVADASGMIHFDSDKHACLMFQEIDYNLIN